MSSGARSPTLRCGGLLRRGRDVAEAAQSQKNRDRERTKRPIAAIQPRLGMAKIVRVGGVGFAAS